MSHERIERVCAHCRRLVLVPPTDLHCPACATLQWPRAEKETMQIEALTRLKIALEIRERFGSAYEYVARWVGDGKCFDGMPLGEDVRGHGAKGDGVTDDTAAFQAAIDALVRK